MRQRIIHQGKVITDQPVRVHIDPDGCCDLCDKETLVTFDLIIHHGDDYPLLRCHSCLGAEASGVRPIGVAVGQAPEGDQLFIVVPDGFVRLDAGHAREVHDALAKLLTGAPPAPPPRNSDAAGTAR
jgi:hypothetical protein